MCHEETCHLSVVAIDLYSADYDLYSIKLRHSCSLHRHLQVVMLSSVTDLLRYIDENQLTSEFGGTLDYCHSDWIVLRTVS